MAPRIKSHGREYPVKGTVTDKERNRSRHERNDRYHAEEHVENILKLGHTKPPLPVEEDEEEMEE
jgi:hypothetical protein